MQKILIGVMVLVICSIVAQPSFARMRDGADYGFCPDGTKVKDIKTCPKAEKPKAEKQKK